VHKCIKGDPGEEDKFYKYSGSPASKIKYERLDKEIDLDYKLMRQST